MQLIHTGSHAESGCMLAALEPVTLAADVYCREGQMAFSYYGVLSILGWKNG